MKRQEKALLLLIIAAFFIRIWQVGSLPTFISDEASIGYNGYSLLKTGKDEWGKSFPLSFKSFGEYKLPVYIYSTVPAIFFFGLSETSTRLPSVLAGTASCFLIFLLASRLFSKKVGFLSALFLAISPWHFEVSRMALEANLALAFILLGFYFLTFAQENKKALYLSFFAFTLSFYTYNVCRLFVPLFLVILFFVERKKWAPILRKNWLAVLMVFVLSLPIFLSGFQGSRERLGKVGIFSDPGIISRLEEKRVFCFEKSSFFWCRLLHNRPLTFSSVFAKNFLSHFSWKFLFSQGSGLAQYQVQEGGSLYLFELPLLLLGIFSLLKEKDKSALVFLLLWALAAPVANSLTGQAHPVRALVLLPVFPILTALGVSFAFSVLKGKGIKILLGTFLTGVVLGSFVSFLVAYFVFYPQKPGSTWQEGYKSLYQKLEEKEEDFEKILVSKFYGEPHIFYLFYRKYDPKFYQEEEGVARYTRSDGWVNVDRIGKYYFDEKGVDIIGEVLYAVPPQEKGADFEVLDEVSWRNGQASFVIGKIR